MSGGPTASFPTSMEELRALVVELVEANAGLREVIAAKDHQIASLERRVAELERQLGADSSTSSRLPSSDSPYRKPARRSSRTSWGADRASSWGAGLDDAAGRGLLAAAEHTDHGVTYYADLVAAMAVVRRHHGGLVVTALVPSVATQTKNTDATDSLQPSTDTR